MPDRVGQQLGNYRLTRLLGQGGFADVYLGEHIHLNTLAAIKVLRTQLMGTDVEQFRNEARTIAHLKHPNIVPILDFGVENNIPYLIMGYASNGTLRQQYPTISADVEEVVMKALAKEPQQRFLSVRAFATAFEHACTPRAVQPPSRPVGAQFIAST